VGTWHPDVCSRRTIVFISVPIRCASVFDVERVDSSKAIVHAVNLSADASKANNTPCIGALAASRTPGRARMVVWGVWWRRWRRWLWWHLRRQRRWGRRRGSWRRGVDEKVRGADVGVEANSSIRVSEIVEDKAELIGGPAVKPVSRVVVAAWLSERDVTNEPRIGRCANRCPLCCLCR